MYPKEKPKAILLLFPFIALWNFFSFLHEEEDQPIGFMMGMTIVNAGILAATKIVVIGIIFIFVGIFFVVRSLF
ncbi:hypothetical protein H8E88_18790 [candidate division KSB1 bacterium]|nr:hypothetical protein [candidate division KSB1 bacterium]MBL7093337.1 hypothetical protein [candidate division KSB1 bacterium]